MDCRQVAVEGCFRSSQLVSQRKIVAGMRQMPQASSCSLRGSGTGCRCEQILRYVENTFKKKDDDDEHTHLEYGEFQAKVLHLLNQQSIALQSQRKKLEPWRELRLLQGLSFQEAQSTELNNHVWD